jgi:tRNA dimethylallyltransferase
MKKKVVIIAGPTCSGKSALAADLALASNGTILNADSMQIYKDLCVLTARPDPLEETIPHRLYGTLKGDDLCSVARWRSFILEEIEHTLKNHSLPIVVGGTGLYLQTLLKGMPSIPEIPSDIRHHIQQDLDRFGVLKLYETLEKEDPLAAQSLHPQDQQRIARALEVIRSTGKSISTWQLESNPQGELYHYIKILILPEKAELCLKAEERFDRMIKIGAIKEVEQLIHQHYPSRSPLLKALGVPEITKYLEGKISLEDAILQAKKATRRYIKRQYTWFRGQFTPDFTLTEIYKTPDLNKVADFIGKALRSDAL